MKANLFLFDYNGFIEEAKPLIQLADKGEFDEVLTYAKGVVNKLNDDWILEGQGTSLKSLEVWSGHQLVGLSFLVIMCKYLSESPLGVSGYFILRNINVVFSKMGWGMEDIDLLESGMSLGYLLKPTDFNDPNERPSQNDKRWHDPRFYSFWVRPEKAFFTGWLDIERLDNIKIKMMADEEKYNNFDFEMIDDPRYISRIANPLKDFKKIIEIIDKALESNIGLFLNGSG